MILLKGRLRAMLRNTWITLAVVLGVAAGVAGVLAMHTVGRQVLERSTEVQSDVANLLVLRKSELSEQDYFELRRTWREGLYPSIAGLTPVIEGTVEFEGRLVRLIGFDPAADTQSPIQAMDSRDVQSFINSKSLILRTNRPVSDDSVKDARIISVRSGSPDLFLADLPTAQELLVRDGELDGIWVRKQTSPSLTWLSFLLPGIEAATQATESNEIRFEGYSTSPLRNWLPMRSMTEAIAFNVGILGCLAILMSGFIAYQALSVGVARSARESERLFALGVGRGTIRSLCLFDSLVIGLTGSGIGIALGLLLLYLAPGLNSAVSSALTDPIAIPKALATGIIVSLMAGLLATRRAPSSNPIVGRVVFVLLAVLVTILGVQEQSGLAGAFLLVLSPCLLHFGIVVPTMTWCSQRSLRLVHSGHLLFRMNLRTGGENFPEMRVSLSALSLAIATAASVGVMVESFRLDFLSVLDQRVSPGLHLRDSANVDLEHVESIPGIAGVQTYFRARATVGSNPVNVIATNLDPQEAATYGAQDLASGEVLINQQASRNLGLGAGDSIVIKHLGEPVSAVIGQVFRDFGEPSLRMIVPLELVNTNQLISDRALIQGSLEGIARAKLWLLDKHPTISPRAGKEIRQISLDIFDRTFAAPRAMTLVAICISALGLFTSLFASQARRLPELRLLHTMGVSKSQLFLLTFGQAASVGIVAVLIAIPLGYAMAYVLCEEVNLRAFAWTVEFHWLVQPMAIYTSAGLVVALVASVFPAVQLANSARLTQNSDSAGH